MESTDPYRSSEARALCSVCSDPTMIACERCGRPLCADHRPAPDERCASCESAYTDRTASEGPAELRRLAKIGTLIFSAYVVFVFAAGFVIGELAVWALILSAAAVTPVLWRRTVVAIDRARRRAFLGERPPEP